MIVHSSRTPTAADHMARVAAASRITAEREAAERRAAEQALANADYAARVLRTLRSEGAVKVGMKICHDTGWKERAVFMIDDPACRAKIIATADEDAEVWGIPATEAEGYFTGTVF